MNPFESPSSSPEAKLQSYPNSQLFFRLLASIPFGCFAGIVAFWSTLDFMENGLGYTVNDSANPMIAFSALAFCGVLAVVSALGFLPFAMGLNLLGRFRPSTAVAFWLAAAVALPAAAAVFIQWRSDSQSVVSTWLSLELLMGPTILAFGATVRLSLLRLEHVPYR